MIIYIAADTSTGVFKVDQDDMVDVLTPIDFFDRLDKVGDNEIIFTIIDTQKDKTIYQKILNEYGIW